MSARWDANTTQLFVRQYREKECLWNWSCSDYMDKRAREKACREIKEVMGIPGFGVPEIKKKIRTLRSTYSQELKKIKIARKHNKMYIPQLKWFKDMHEFIQKCMRFGQSGRMQQLRNKLDDVENDAENLVKYKLVGGALKLKANVYPHKFVCQNHKEVRSKKEKRVCKKRRRNESHNNDLEKEAPSTSSELSSFPCFEMIECGKMELDRIENLLPEGNAVTEPVPYDHEKCQDDTGNIEIKSETIIDSEFVDEEFDGSTGRYSNEFNGEYVQGLLDGELLPSESERLTPASNSTLTDMRINCCSSNDVWFKQEDLQLDDEFEVFGRHVAIQLRLLKLVNAGRARSKIQEILTGLKTEYNIKV